MGPKEQKRMQKEELGAGCAEQTAQETKPHATRRTNTRPIRPLTRWEERVAHRRGEARRHDAFKQGRAAAAPGGVLRSCGGLGHCRPGTDGGRNRDSDTEAFVKQPQLVVNELAVRLEPVADELGVRLAETDQAIAERKVEL